MRSSILAWRRAGGSLSLAWQFEADDEAAFRAVPRPNLAMMQPYRAVSDRQSNPESTGVALSCVVSPVEGSKDILQLILWKPRPAITHIKCDHARANLFFATELELDHRLLARVANGVANNVLDGAVN